MLDNILLNFFIQVPSVPSNLNCVSWSGQGTAIVQVSVYVAYILTRYHVSCAIIKFMGDGVEFYMYLYDFFCM